MSEEKPSIKIRNAIDNLKLDYSKLDKGEIGESELKENNSFILDSYPTLASKVKDNTLDLEIINHMLMNLDKMHEGKQSEHEASVDVGTLLRDKIVIPDMKSRGLNVNTDDSISQLSEKEAKEKVGKLFQL